MAEARVRARKRHGNGQLRPLRDRMTPQQYMSRLTNITARKTVAEALEAKQAQIIAGTRRALGVTELGFWGRLRWLLSGHHRS